MSKLLWVLLPLLLACAAAAAMFWRGRAPSRLTLNVASSLLLLAYVATTAGLGIFWVANQQLPVFDWHYLFGYATVGLLALHLAFNFRVVWQVPARRRRKAATPPGTRRRRAAAALALTPPRVGRAGAARHRCLRAAAYSARPAQWPRARSVAARPPEAGGDTALALVEQFHDFSAHSRSAVLRRAAASDWGGAPPPFKAFAASAVTARQALPPPNQADRRPAGRRRHDVALLGTLLWHTAGISLRRGGLALRCSPSSGALFATELYVWVRRLPGLAPGLWHYDAQAHALQRLGDGLPPAAALGLDAPDDALALVVATAVFARSGHKYGDRTYRYVLADLGHALENLRAAAEAVGVRASLLPHFDGARLAAALDIDEREEGVLALAVLQPAGAALPAAAAARPVAGAGWAPPAWPADMSGPQRVTDAVHRATSLRTTVAPTAAASMPAASAPPGGPLQPLPAAPPPARDVLQVIAARRSLRRFSDAPLPLPLLSAVLAAMAATPPLLSPAVRIDVLTPAVDGLPPAAWRYDPAAHALALRVRHDDGLRRRARAAALDQDVIGNAAAVLVLSLSRADFSADTAGAARGYRHAFLEAGLVGERVYLEGGARGLGVCAVGAFYDDELAALAGIDARKEWVVHLAALGRTA